VRTISNEGVEHTSPPPLPLITSEIIRSDVFEFCVTRTSDSIKNYHALSITRIARRWQQGAHLCVSVQYEM
jgi:hypothetical protein